MSTFLKLRKYFIIITLLTLLGGIYLNYAKQKPLLWGYHEFYYTPSKYKAKLSRLALIRTKLEPDRPNLNRIFVNHFSNLMPFWYGTRYSFYGQTHTPGEGTIACGYFVTTVLQDLGIPIERDKLAQLPSEEMIKALVAKKSIQRFSKYDIDDFLQRITLSGKGLYIVGLDTHTGFLLYENSEIRFIHASGSFPFAVVNEKAKDAKALQKSIYRVVGKVSDDEEFLGKWVRKTNARL
jgi:hypothetical protein